MPTYRVTLHTHTGREYLITTDDGEVEARLTAEFRWREAGDEGEITYDDVDTVDIEELVDAG